MTAEGDMALVNKLPVPSPGALELSAALSSRLRDEITAAGGTIPFSRYMERCLYEPGLGYYSAGLTKFGAAGDFVTAPEISSLFGQCLARTCAALLQEIGGGDVLEFGAGSGKLAADMLQALNREQCLPTHYYILERSADLRARQRETISQLAGDLIERVVWLDGLPDHGFEGLMLANEVLDAMAVERFRYRDRLFELFHVCAEGDTFAWRTRAADGPMATRLAALNEAVTFPDGFISEINPGLESWIASVAETLARGLLLLIDYGGPRHEVYHPQRSDGTLMCHYRHRAHADPFLYPGLQDMTAHVDFTAVAEAAVNAGLDVFGYTSQSWFLLDCGMDRLLSETDVEDSAAWLRQVQQAKTLILPNEMGERFKCMGLSKGMTGHVPGFGNRDDRHRL